MMATVFIFALVDTTSKYLTAFFSVQLIVWARYTIHLLLMLVFVAPRMGRQIIATQKPALLSLRALALVACSFFVVMAFKTLPLAETIAIIFLSPVFIAFLSKPMLGEKMSRKNWLATLAGFIGVLLIARPGSALDPIGVIYALLGTLCNALYQILTRKLASTEPPMRQLFYTALIGCMVMSCLVPTYWTGRIPNLQQALLLISLGVNGGVSHFLLSRAFRDAPIATLSPLLYVQLVWTAFFGWLIFAHIPDHFAILGMLVIGAAGLMLTLGKRKYPV